MFAVDISDPVVDEQAIAEAVVVGEVTATLNHPGPSLAVAASSGETITVDEPIVAYPQATPFGLPQDDPVATALEVIADSAESESISVLASEPLLAGEMLSQDSGDFALSDLPWIVGDVDGNGAVQPIDLLIVINGLNSEIPVELTAGDPRDVNVDGLLSAADADAIIAILNAAEHMAADASESLGDSAEFAADQQPLAEPQEYDYGGMVAGEGESSEATFSAIATPSPSWTPSPTPSYTSSPTPTYTPSPTPTFTPSPTPTFTPSPTPTYTPSPTPTFTPSPTPTFSPSPTPTYTPSPTPTFTPSPTPTYTPSPTPTSNSIPDPSNDWAYTIHDQIATGNVAGNDGLTPEYDVVTLELTHWEDYEGDTVSFVLVDDVSNGTLTLDPVTGDFTYQPSTGYVGPDWFTYQLSDGLGTSTYTATVDIYVSNSIPEPSNDWAYTIHDQVATGNVAGNDGLTPEYDVVTLELTHWEDYEGDTVSFVLVDDVSNGTLTLDPVTGEFTYQPSTGYVGPDWFTYQLSDGLGTSTYTATVDIYVSNSIPDPSNDWAYTIHDQVATGNVAGNDGLTPEYDVVTLELTHWKDYEGDTVSFVLVDDVSNGTLTLDAATGEFTYEPSIGYVGHDWFTYQLSDGLGTSTYTATVSIGVNNSIPEPSDDGTFMIGCNCDPDEKTGNVAANDGLTADGDNWKDSDGDSVTFAVVDDVSNGTLTLDSDTGEFKYVQNEGYIGDDTFTYEISDGLGTSTTKATVSLSVVGKTVPATPPTIQGSVTVDGNATSSAAKGTHPNGKITTDDQLIYWKYYYMQYDGPTEFKGDYTVNLNADGTFDPTNSTVKFTTVNYTSRYQMQVRDSLTPAQIAAYEAQGKTVYHEGGKFYILKAPELKPSGWQTLSIPITEATIMNGRLHSFKFKGDWYSDLPAGFVDKGIEGEVDLKKCKAEFTAKYQEPYNGSIATYVTTGKIKN